MTGEGQEKETTKDKDRYIFKLVESEELNEWINERAGEGYVHDWLRMVPTQSGQPLRFAILMRLGLSLRLQVEDSNE